MRRCVFAALGLAGTLSACATVPSSGPLAQGAPPAAESVSGTYLSANLAAQEGDVFAASNYLGEMLKSDPTNADLLERAFVYAAQSGDFEHAVPLAVRVLNQDPDDRFARLVVAASSLVKKDYAAADMQIVQEGGGAFTILVTTLVQTWAEAGAGRVDDAIKTIDRIKGQPGVEGLYALHRALVLDYAGRDMEAEAAYRAAIAIIGTGPRASDAFGRFLRRHNRVDEAKAIYQRLSGTAAALPLAQYALADIAAGRMPQPLVATPADGVAEGLFAVAASLNGDNGGDVAMLYLNVALFLRPDFDLVRALLGDRLEQAGQYELAIAAYSKVPASSPYHAMVQLQSANDESRLGRSDAAIAKMRALAIEMPNDPDIATGLADLLRASDRCQEALPVYDRAIQAAGNAGNRAATLYYSRGICRVDLDRWDEAEKDFQKALELNPNRADVLNFLGYSWVDMGENLDEAVRMLEKAHSLRPLDGYITDSVGWAYFKLGRYAEAAQLLEEAVQNSPAAADVNDHLGDAYWRVGRKLDARFEWSHALSLNPDAALKTSLEKKLQLGLDAAQRGFVSERAVGAFAPAKINLFLHVGDKRADGYHALESLVVFADVGDRIIAEPADGLSLEVTGPFAGPLKHLQDNLVLKAAHALAERGARLTLEKNLPIASGIGGGSADAAAALRVLNQVWDLRRSEAELLGLATQIGSDVPACLLSCPLWMEGRGESVRAIAPLPPLRLVLVNPGIAVETASVFRNLNARTGLGVMAPPRTAIASVWDLVAYLNGAQNDLEQPAIAMWPVIDQVIDALGHEPGCVLSQMSGSGATCFGIFQDGPWADGAAERLAQDHPDWWVKAARIAPPDIGAPS